MSWDVFVQEIPVGIRTPADIPDGLRPTGLGLTRADIIAEARLVGGAVDASDPSWAPWSGPGHDIELNLGDDPVDHFALHCRGDLDECRRAAEALVRGLGVRGFAVEDGVILG